MEEAEGGSGFKYCDNLGELMEMTAVTRLYPPVPVKKWYIADSDLTVQEVLEVLELYHISSLPVRNVSTGKCAGFIDSLDILGYLISVCTPSVEAGATLTDLDKAFEKFCTKGISELCDFSKRNPFVPIPINQNLYYMLENIKRYATIAVHRVPIVSLDEQDPKIMALVSQSDIAAYLAKHISVLGPRGQLPVRDHFRAFTKVVSVPPHSKALDAFALMWSKGLGGVAVIDSQKRLVANLSATDLECLFRKQFFRLFMPVVDYIKAVYADKKEIMTPPLSVTPETTLETLILKFAGTRVHRLYVVDGSGVLCGVITLTDLMNLIVTEWGLDQ
jgi:CBS domain-containing protein